MVEHLVQLDPLRASDHIGLNLSMKYGTIPPSVTKTVYDYNRGDFTAMKDFLAIDCAEKLKELSVLVMAN